MTLWLTRIQPNLQHRDARRDLASAVGMHHRLMHLFPDGTGPEARRIHGVLWRIDNNPQGPYILLQSRTQPNLTNLPTTYGTATTKPIAALLDALTPHRTVHYRIAASAIRRPGRTTRETYGLKEVVPLHGPAAEQWWTHQAHDAGLTLTTLHTTPLDPARGQRNDQHRIRHSRTLFHGTARITNPDQLRQRLTDGIGRGKAYGCGLLSLAPHHQPHTN